MCILWSALLYTFGLTSELAQSEPLITGIRNVWYMDPGSTEFLQFKTWWRDEAEMTSQCNTPANPPVPISADQLTVSGDWFGINWKQQYDDIVV